MPSSAYLCIAKQFAITYYYYLYFLLCFFSLFSFSSDFIHIRFPNNPYLYCHAHTRTQVPNISTENWMISCEISLCNYIYAYILSRPLS